MKYRISCLILAATACLMMSCDSQQRQSYPEPDSFSLRTLPIINGTAVSGDDHLATVALVMDYGYGTPDAFCTGTLITPNYVLTAGHCISYCKGDDTNIEEYRPVMAIGIGQSEGTFRKVIPITEFYTHPQFVCSPYLISNDIAIVKLEKPVALSDVTPILPMPPAFDMTVAEVDSYDGVEVETVGFGLTDPNNNYSSGKKYKTSMRVYAYCPTDGNQSKKCGTSMTDNDGFIYFNATHTGTCQGDSGGPTFMKRDGIPFVVGVTSYGYDECRYVSAMTLVSEHFEWISGIAKDLSADSPEDCTNQVDDNNDGRIDCDDPYCFVLKECIPEDCANHKDDNDNGLLDCADPQCQSELLCQPEDCTNKLDDNGNGLIDCDDPQCFDKLICVPENCANNIDDNGNGLTDCEETDVCAKALHCIPEVCDNRRDDNGNDLIDCNDPQCADAKICQPEICDDRLDNNDNNKVDCEDPQCFTALVCQPEICDNTTDDNGNGLADCNDPACAAALNCQVEVCDNMADDNGNGLIDCDEPSCAEFCAAQSSCSASSNSRSGSMAWLLALVSMTLCGIFRRRRAC